MKKGESRIGKILEAFASDQLCVNRVTEKRNPKHQKLCERNCELQEKLEEKLDDEGKGLLNQLIDCIVDEESYNSQNNFIRGYLLGMMMAFEMLEEYDSFLGKEG